MSFLPKLDRSTTAADGVEHLPFKIVRGERNLLVDAPPPQRHAPIRLLPPPDDEHARHFARAGVAYVSGHGFAGRGNFGAYELRSQPPHDLLRIRTNAVRDGNDEHLHRGKPDRKRSVVELRQKCDETIENRAWRPVCAARRLESENRVPKI